MPRVRVNAVFATNWTDLESVKALARKFGKGQTVVKHKDRVNYNIVHTERTDLYTADEVLYQT